MSDDLSTVCVGDHVTDRDKDDDVIMVVVGRSPIPAKDWNINRSMTVADVNEEYPENDTVIEVIFPQKHHLDVDDASQYAYPQSRLRQVEPVHDS